MSCYYNVSVKKFLRDTLEVDKEELYRAFLERLPKRAIILDAGCGLGRDSLHFKELGHLIMAMDDSEELCQCAGEYIGQSVLLSHFHDMHFKISFDGIWAYASLVHIGSKEIVDVLRQFAWYLKDGGTIYTSYRYGNFEGERNGYHYLELTEEKAAQFFTEAGFNVERMWITHNMRKDHVDEKWLNILAEKVK